MSDDEGSSEYEQASDEEEEEQLDDDTPFEDVFAELCASAKAAGFKPKFDATTTAGWEQVYAELSALMEKCFISPVQDH